MSVNIHGNILTEGSLYPPEVMSGAFQDGYIDDSFNGNVLPSSRNGPSQNKRRRLSDGMENPNEGLMVRGRTFLPIRGGNEVFSTDEWKSSGTALFSPIRQDLYINLSKYDQISAAQGSFYTADDSGNFETSLIGHVIHLWRYDKLKRKQYISQSFLFTNNQEFLNIQAFLQNI